MTRASRNLLPHVASKVLNEPLMIDPRKLTTILASPVGMRFGLQAEGDPEPLVFDDEQDDEEERTPARLAVLRISGTLVTRARGIRAFSGLAGYQQIRSAMDEALDDDEIDGLLFDFDSFGGEAQGAFDLADAILSARGRKPMWAVANENAFSAAYLLASACERVYLPRTAGVGSIGVVIAHVDESGADRDMGLKWTLLKAGDKKVDGNSHEPLSERARGDLQARVERLYSLFVDTIGKHGRISAEKARETEAGLFFGQEAIDAGLADRLGTFDDAINDMDEEIRRSRRKPSASPFGRVPRLAGVGG